MPERPDDFERRLADRLRAYEADLPAAEAPAPVGSPGGRRWPAVVVVAGAAVAAGALVGAVLLGMPRIDVAQSSPSPTPTVGPTETASVEPSNTPRPTPSRSEQPTPSADVTPTPTPLPSGAAALTWSPGEAPNTSVFTVTRLGDDWFAGGSLDGRAAAWTSADGLSWTAADPIDPAPIASGETDPERAFWMSTIVGYHNELLGFGWNRIGCCDGGRPMAWSSEDGNEWAVLPTEGTAFDAYQFPAAAVIAPGGELVVLGGTGLGSGASAFVTSDLETWSEHVITESEAFAGSLYDLAASPALLVAVGELWGGEGQQVWTSRDGRTWTSVPAPEELGRLSSIAWDPTRQRFVVGGQDGEGRPVIYLSVDAHRWSRIVLSNDDGQVSALDAAEGLIVAGGWTESMLDEEGKAWSSHDGVTWQVAPMRIPVRTVAVSADRAVAFLESGGEEPDYVPEYEVWLGTR